MALTGALSAIWRCNSQLALAAVHGIVTTWLYCDEAGCEHRAKRAADIKKHKAMVHGIGTTWFYCDEAGCEHRAKVASSIKVHNERERHVALTVCSQRHMALTGALSAIWR